MEIKTVQVLNILLRKEGYVTLNELSAKTGLQERSIRYEIDKLKELLKPFSDIQLLQNRKRGIQLQALPQAKHNLVKHLSEQEKWDYLTNEERMAITSILFLDEKERVTQNRLMKQFLISPTTVKKDRRTIEILLGEYQLKLFSDIQRGYYIEGPEQGKRNFIFSLMVQSMDLEQAVFKDTVRYGTRAEQVMLRYLDKDNICEMKKRLTALYQKRNIKASAAAFEQMSLLLGIQKKRLSEGHMIIQMPEESRYEMQNRDLISEIEELILESHLTEPEIKYLTDYIAAFTGREEKDFLMMPNWLEIQLDTIELIMEMERYAGTVFLSGDEMRENLFNHMEVLVHRIKSGIKIHNPLTEMIKDKYGYVYEYCRQAVVFLEKKYQKKISDEEIAYLTIYFYAYLEDKEPLKVMVVCGQGLSTGHLLAENLKKVFPFHIVGVLSYVEKHTINHLDVDLVISTIDVEGLGIPVLKVSPILEQADIEKIRECLQQQEWGGRADHRQDTVLVDKLVGVAAECSKGLDISRYATQVMKLLCEHKIIGKRSFEQLMIKDVLTADCIQLKQKAGSWQEAIRVSAEPLLENQAIEPRYIEAMISNVETYGPYIVIAPGIALAHARPEDGVNAVGLSVTTLEHPVVFGNEHYDPVELVVCLAAADTFSHLEVLSNIAEIINNQSYVSRLKACGSREEFLSLVLQAEQEITD